MPPTDRIAKLEAKLEKLREVYARYEDLDDLFRTSGASDYKDLWLAIKEAVKEDEDAKSQ